MHHRNDWMCNIWIRVDLILKDLSSALESLKALTITMRGCQFASHLFYFACQVKIVRDSVNP